MVFSNEASFHVSEKVNWHNVRIWGSQNPYEVVEKERDSLKLNVWCGLMHNQIIGPFIFAVVMGPQKVYTTCMWKQIVAVSLASLPKINDNYHD